MKQIKFKREGSGYRVLDVIGDIENKTWGKIKGDFIYDYQFRAVKFDIIKDSFKIVIL